MKQFNQRSRGKARLALTAGIMLAVAFTISCEAAGGSSAFVGKWVRDDGSEPMELFKDGTGVAQEKKKKISMSVSWKVVDKRFVMTTIVLGTSVSEAYDYEILDRILKLTDSKGNSEIYVKVQEGKIEGKTLTDKRDGKKYKTVIIGTQTWMAENLNYEAEGSKCYGEGGQVVTAFDKDGNPTETKKLPDKEVQNNCAKYGRLYDWETATKACPSGWHLPSKEEWRKLTGFIGGEKIEGKKLKSKSGWNKNGNGTDEYGFSALPGGDGGSDGSFANVGGSGNWWSASEDNSNSAYGRGIYYDDEYALWYDDDKTTLLSVRCLQD